MEFQANLAYNKKTFRRRNSIKTMNRIFFVAVIMLMLVSSLTYSVEDPDKSMVLYLSFDQLNGKKVDDHSKYGNHGETAGKPKLVEGKFGKCLEFNGKSDWVVVPHHKTLCVEEQVTVMAWIKTERFTDPATRWQGILAKSNATRSYSFYTTSDAGGALHFSAAGGSVSNKIKLNEWQHVVAQMTEKGQHQYYINGENGGSGGGGVLPGEKDVDDVLVGKTHEGTREFLGLIDEVRIWNRELSQKEVKEHMNMGYDELFPVDPRQRLTTTWGALKKM